MCHLYLWERLLLLTSKKAFPSGVWTEKWKVLSELDNSSSLAATTFSRNWDLCIKKKQKKTWKLKRSPCLFIYTFYFMQHTSFQSCFQSKAESTNYVFKVQDDISCFLWPKIIISICTSVCFLGGWHLVWLWRINFTHPKPHHCHKRFDVYFTRSSHTFTFTTL